MAYGPNRRRLLRRSSTVQIEDCGLRRTGAQWTGPPNPVLRCPWVSPSVRRHGSSKTAPVYCDAGAPCDMTWCSVWCGVRCLSCDDGPECAERCVVVALHVTQTICMLPRVGQTTYPPSTNAMQRSCNFMQQSCTALQPECNTAPQCRYRRCQHQRPAMQPSQSVLPRSHTALQTAYNAIQWSHAHHEAPCNTVHCPVVQHLGHTMLCHGNSKVCNGRATLRTGQAMLCSGCAPLRTRQRHDVQQPCNAWYSVASPLRSIAWRRAWVGKRRRGSRGSKRRTQ